MTKRMLIDASHPEETRVVVLNDHLLEDFDFESSTKKQIKGNIYLAKITRVEPSLQAAFVDYGGNRHGFLAFSEIHPDYYQIPQADRRLLEEASRAQQADANGAHEEHEPEGQDGAEAVATDPDEETAEVIDEQARRRSQLLRGYKIQEVIKRRQIMLVQVVKEERGNKGAALTTYLSLAGRYCVLMPNTARGGGISRKISNPADRSRLKAIARELEVPDGMGLIIRTAGQQRNKQEIRRDYEYLLRLWNDIRELTLRSIAPCLVQEEGALVQRAIRDLYARDVDEVLVEGEEGYRLARKGMSMLMPSRARRVKLYKEDVPLFHHYGVEDRLDAMHSPVIQLKSGGSIVIHTTEALTAIDVNSGRSTRERNIEETALKTNLEAADEVSRQLRLRDLAGLVVVDFIDMGEMRNQRAVERRVREALKTDRARVQLGRISPFGLLELSRQRLRPSFQELSTQPCPICNGIGVVRSTGSSALQVLRAIEVEGLKGTVMAIGVTVALPTALYLLNQKRDRLMGLEQRYGMTVDVRVDENLIAGEFRLEHTERRIEAEPAERAELPTVEAPAEQPADAPSAPSASVVSEEDGDGGKRRRRRRRRRKRSSDAPAETGRPPMAARANGDARELYDPSDAEETSDLVEVEADEPRLAEMAAPDLGIEARQESDAEPAAEDVPAKRPRRRRGGTKRPRAKREAEAESIDAIEGPDQEERHAAADVPQPFVARWDEATPPSGRDTDDRVAEAEEAAPEPGGEPDRSAQPDHASDAQAVEQVPAAAAAADDSVAEDVAREDSGAEEEVEEARSPDVPAAAMVERKRGGPVRRGWWSRFARKDD